MRVAVVAPSGPVDHDALRVGKERLSALRPGLEFVHAPNLAADIGYLAGEDDERIAAFRWAFSEPGIDLVWFARGGFGTTRIIDRIPWSELAATGRPLLGYSDATAFLAAYDAAGGRAVHAPMIAADLARSATPRAWESVTRWLNGDDDTFAFQGEWAGSSTGAVEGTISGPILAGNLAVLAAMAGTKHFPAARDSAGRGRLVCLEEVHEEPYRVDRLLTQLAAAGLFDGASGLVFGSMTECVPEDPKKSWSVEEVLRRAATDLGLPAILGFPFGHGGTNSILPWGNELQVTSSKAGFSVRVVHRA